MEFFLSGNEAIAFGLIQGGVRFITGYPGTPSSEVIPTAIDIKSKLGLNGYFEWSVNEKVALEEALSASFTGIDSAVTFKQVGLNAAMDPFMNAALTGNVGGFVVVSADDPGPHSSQTEQDSRFLAFFAKIPVLDPSTPKEAYQFAADAVSLSKKYSMPVMLRSTTRISHSREDIDVKEINSITIDADFKKDSDRFAATPHFRYLLHKALNKKIEQIRLNNKPRLFFEGNVLIITSGITYSYIYDIVKKYGLENEVRIAKFDMPYPINADALQRIIDIHKKTIVIEDSYPVLEMQIKNRENVLSRMNNNMPNEGEYTYDVCEDVLDKLGVLTKKQYASFNPPPFIRPSLCAGCGHRSAFFAIKKVFKDDAIYTGDIGCYTLGLNLNAVDTVHCMGASISFGFGLSKAYKLAGKFKHIVATIGDSTFFHSGIPALIDAVHNRVPIIVVILDNSTVAMTGNQKTAADNKDSCGGTAHSIKIKDIVKSLGVEFLKEEDAYDVKSSENILERAKEYVENNNLPAVLILSHPCIYEKQNLKANIKIKVDINNDKCRGCKICMDDFECPALMFNNNNKKVEIDRMQCIDCGECIYSCPFGAIEEKK